MAGFNKVTIIDERTDGIRKKIASPMVEKPKIIELSTVTVADSTVVLSDVVPTFVKGGWSATVPTGYMIYCENSTKPVEVSLTSVADTEEGNFYSVLDVVNNAVNDLSVFTGAGSVTGYPIIGKSNHYPTSISQITPTGNPRELVIQLDINAKDRDIQTGYIYIFNTDSTLTNTPVEGIAMKVLNYENKRVVRVRAVREEDSLADITHANRTKLHCRFSGSEDLPESFLVYKMGTATLTKSVYKIYNE